MNIAFRHLLAVLLAGTLAAAIGCTDAPPETTPLKHFSAPFVFGRFSVPEQNPLTEQAVALGRQLFYDPSLSANGQVSCASCHQQARAFTDPRPVSVGVSGQPLAFNSMSLANLLWGPPHFFWDGRAASLEAQALAPLQHPDEMGRELDELIKQLDADAHYRALFKAAYGRVSAEHLAAALASFQRTLISANSRYDQFLRGEVTLSNEEEQGRKLFMAHPDAKASQRGGNCIDCHSQFLTAGFSTRFDGFSNNGLDDDANLKPGLMAVTGQPEHRGLFKVPSLRNIAVTAPYMHDGRFVTLEQVLDHYNHGIKPSATLSPLIVEASNSEDPNADISLSLSEAEQRAIIAFLHTLTDEKFLTNPDHANPFDEVP